MSKKSHQDSSSSDNEEPEAVSLSTSKAEIISQIKSERDAKRLSREQARQKTLKVQKQNVQARQRKAKEAEEALDHESESESSIQTEEISNSISPLPDNILSSAFSQKPQHTNLDNSESEAESVDPLQVQEIIREHRAKINKRRLIDTLPYSVVQVGLNGKSRISREELKARRNISKTKFQSAGSQVRRIDSILNRARKGKAPAAVFHRQNSFY